MISYYIADKKPSDINFEFLESIGLGYAFDESTPIEVGEVSANGPNGGRGVVVSRGAMFTKIRPNGQRFEPHVMVDNCWIVYPEEITSESLKRPTWKEIDSYTLRGVWTIPVARIWTADGHVTNLRRKLKFTGTGYVPGEVTKDYQTLERIGLECVSLLEDGTLPENATELCAEVIGLVYFLGPQEFADLEIVTDDVRDVIGLLKCVVDFQGYLELNEKKSSD